MADRGGEQRLHLACGGVLLPGWVNIDGRAREGVVQVDLPHGLERFADGCARDIYCSHFLEHLAYPDDATALVRHCHRLLVPGGTLRLVVPGVEKIIRAYVERNEAFFRVQATLHPAWCTTPLEHLMYALQQDGEHRYGYDFETLEKLLRGVGFAQVRPCDFNRSPDESLRVDYRDIRDDRDGYLSLFVEAVKGAWKDRRADG
jgi:SAM-dependent methyltransferase